MHRLFYLWVDQPSSDAALALSVACTSRSCISRSTRVFVLLSPNNLNFLSHSLLFFFLDGALVRVRVMLSAYSRGFPWVVSHGVSLPNPKLKLSVGHLLVIILTYQEIHSTLSACPRCMFSIFKPL